MHLNPIPSNHGHQQRASPTSQSAPGRHRRQQQAQPDGLKEQLLLPHNSSLSGAAYLLLPSRPDTLHRMDSADSRGRFQELLGPSGRLGRNLHGLEHLKEARRALPQTLPGVFSIPEEVVDLVEEWGR